MASIYQLKPKFQNLLRPQVVRLAERGVSANQVTLAALGLSIIVGLLLYALPYRVTAILIPITLFVRMALNAIDGMLAREHNMQSSLGAILNELSDVVSDAALYLPFAMLAPFNGALIAVIVLLAVVSEMAGVVAVQIGASRRYDGPMGKSDRAFLFGLLALLYAFGVDLSQWGNWALWGIFVLLLLTIYNRCRRALKELESKQQHE